MHQDALLNFLRKTSSLKIPKFKKKQSQSPAAQPSKDESREEL